MNSRRDMATEALYHQMCLTEGVGLGGHHVVKARKPSLWMRSWLCLLLRTLVGSSEEGLLFRDHTHSSVGSTASPED